MNKIQINDRVKCINAGRQGAQKVSEVVTGLIEGREYIVYGKSTKLCCGAKIVDIGMTNILSEGMVICRCGSQEYSKQDDINWKYADRFRKVEEDTKKEEKVSAIKLTETLVLSEN